MTTGLSDRGLSFELRLTLDHGMQNASTWRPSKFVMKGGRLRATSDRSELGVGSRLVANLVAEAYERSIEVYVSGSLLDMGCGKAPLYGAYRKFATDVQCIDWENSAHGANYLDKVCDLGEAVPYPDGSFDTIVLSDVLEHLRDPLNCWREMQRLLAPGGKVLLNVPFYYQLHEEPHDYYRYTQFALRYFAESSGFRVIELRPLGGAFEVLADVAGKLFAGARLSFAARAVQYVARVFSRTAIGSRISRRTSERFPLAYFMVAEKKGL